jgi:hypothetical protein
VSVTARFMQEAKSVREEICRFVLRPRSAAAKRYQYQERCDPGFRARECICRGLVPY